MTCLGLLAFFAFVASPAMADNCVAPPGTSGIDQYCEALPSPGGSSHHGGSGGGAAGSKLPPATKRALARQGAAGAGVLALTRQGGVETPSQSTGGSTTGPATQHRPAHHRHAHQNSTAAGQPSAPAPASIPAAPASNPVSAVGNSVSLGGGLIAVLLASGAALALLAWAGWRRRSSAGPA